MAVSWKIIRHIGVIKEEPSGWKREINLVSWNNGQPRWDIRAWDEEHKSMSKGITLSDEEMATLLTLMKGENLGGECDE